MLPFLFLFEQIVLRFFCLALFDRPVSLGCPDPLLLFVEVQTALPAGLPGRQKKQKAKRGCEISGCAVWAGTWHRRPPTKYSLYEVLVLVRDVRMCSLGSPCRYTTSRLNSFISLLFENITCVWSLNLSVSLSLYVCVCVCRCPPPRPGWVGAGQTFSPPHGGCIPVLYLRAS